MAETIRTPGGINPLQYMKWPNQLGPGFAPQDMWQGPQGMVIQAPQVQPSTAAQQYEEFMVRQQQANQQQRAVGGVPRQAAAAEAYGNREQPQSVVAAAKPTPAPAPKSDIAPAPGGATRLTEWLRDHPRIAGFLENRPELKARVGEIAARRDTDSEGGPTGIIGRIMEFARENPMATMGFGAGLAAGGNNAFNNAFANMNAGYQSDLASRPAPPETFGPLISGEELFGEGAEGYYQQGPDGQWRQIGGGGVNVDVNTGTEGHIGGVGVNSGREYAPLDDPAQYYRLAEDEDGNILRGEDDKPLIWEDSNGRPRIETVPTYEAGDPAKARGALFAATQQMQVFERTAVQALDLIGNAAEAEGLDEEGLQGFTNDLVNFLVGDETAGIGQILNWVPGSDQNALRETLTTLRSIIGFEELTEMRRNSPTGGALGQVSNFENRLLQAVRGSLSQGLRADILADNIRFVRDLQRDALAAHYWAYAQDFPDELVNMPQFNDFGQPEFFTHEELGVGAANANVGEEMFMNENGQAVRYVLVFNRTSDNPQDVWMRTPWGLNDE